MRYTGLEIDEVCVIKVNYQSGQSFYCDGFDGLSALRILNDIEKIDLIDLNIETADPTIVKYEGKLLKDFAAISTFNELMYAIEKEEEILGDYLFIHRLEFRSDYVDLYMDDDRYIWISADVLTSFEDLVAKMLDTLKFSGEAIENILRYAYENQEEYIKVDINGKVLGKYKNQEEYHSDWFGHKSIHIPFWERVAKLWKRK